MKMTCIYISDAAPVYVCVVVQYIGISFRNIYIGMNIILVQLCLMLFRVEQDHGNMKFVTCKHRMIPTFQKSLQSHLTTYIEGISSLSWKIEEFKW